MPANKNLKAASDWPSAMLEEFSRARFTAARGIYDQAVAAGARPTIEVTLLQARALLKIQQEKVVPFLLQQRLERGTKTQQATRAMYLGIAYARMNDFEEADRYFSAAEPSLKKSAELAELAYHRSRRHLLQLNTARAWEFYEGTRNDASLRGRVLSEHLKSFILSQEERYADETSSLLKVLNLIGKKREAFLEIWYTAVHTLAVVARELPIALASDRAQQEIESDLDWSPDFAVQRFQALKAVGWCQALRGDSFNCFRFLRKAQTMAPGPAWSAMALLDRAYFARIIGEKQWAQNEIAAAEDVVTDVDWENTTGEERVALLLLVELVSSADAQRATYYMARFNNLGKIRSNLLQIAFDHRMEALAAYANGVAKQAIGDTPAATVSFKKAWSDFDRIGYDWRAGRTAIQLLHVTGKPRWRHLAEDKLEAYENSWLSGELLSANQKSSENAIPRLTRAEEKVFRMICAGLTTEAIASELGRSEQTIRNHIKPIFKAFGVKTRSALVAEAAKRGLLNTT